MALTNNKKSNGSNTATSAATTTTAKHKPLSAKHIFKLAYALALPGRFHRDLTRFIKCAYLYEHKRQNGVDNVRAGRGFHEACLLAQGFYQIESGDTDNDGDDDDDDSTSSAFMITLPSRIDRIWSAAQMFLLRGMVSMGDGNGNLLELDRVEAVSNAETHASVKVPAYNDEEERRRGPDLTPDDLPSLLSRWNKMAIPGTDLPASTTFLWACAGCTLGTHCIPVSEWHRPSQVDSLSLEEVTAKVAGVARRLQFNERQAKLLENTTGNNSTHDQKAVYLRHRRLWMPYPGPLALIPGPPSQSQLEATVTDLCRLLTAKEREYRLLQRVVGKPAMVASEIRVRVEAEAQAEAMRANK